MSTKSSPFVQIKTTFKVALSPDSSSNPIHYIRKQLNDLLHKYSNEVSGVILSYGSLNFEKGKEYARIIGEFPWLHVTVNTKCLVFQPRVGLIVKATVSKIWPSHVSLLVFGLFNASVNNEELCNRYSYHEQENAWISLEGYERIEIASEVTIRVTSHQELKGVLNIVGSLDLAGSDDNNESII